MWVYKSVPREPTDKGWQPPGFLPGEKMVKVWEDPVEVIAERIGVEMKPPTPDATRVEEVRMPDGTVQLFPAKRIRGRSILMASMQSPFAPSKEALEVRAANLKAAEEARKAAHQQKYPTPPAEVLHSSPETQSGIEEQKKLEAVGHDAMALHLKALKTERERVRKAAWRARRASLEGP